MARDIPYATWEYFRKFFINYRERIVQSPIAQFENGVMISQSLIAFSETFKISWTHYIQLMKIDEAAEREFYELESVGNNWSVRELQRQYHSSIYQRLALSRDKESVRRANKVGEISDSPIATLKTPVVLEFLGLKEDHRYSENDLETAIIFG
jgi:hypothetical protein